MSNEHTKNHNPFLTLKHQIHDGKYAGRVVSRSDLQMDNNQFVPIPWKQIARTDKGNS